MKNPIQAFVYLLLMLFSLNLDSQNIERIYFEKELPLGLQVQSSRPDGLKISLSIPRLSLISEHDSEKTWHKISTAGVFLPGEAGSPELPRFARYIAIPHGAGLEVSIIDSRSDIIENIHIKPSKGVPLDQGPEFDFSINNQIYNNNEFWPNEPVIISEASNIRGQEVIMLSVSPFQFNPVTNELRVIYDLTIQVSFKGQNSFLGGEKYRNHWWDMLQQDFILNASQLPPAVQKTIPDPIGYEYLIITPDKPEFIAWADSIKEFRQKQGIITGVRTISQIGGNTVSAISSYVSNAYQNWDIPPVAVLLLADYSSDEHGITSPRFNHTHSGFGGNYITDNRFSDMTGNNLPDIVFARITANNNEELQTMVSKFISYETHPPMDPGFYNQPVTAVGWQTDRWFQLGAEIVGGFWKNSLGKSPKRINAIWSGHPENGIWSTADNTSQILDYFGESGLEYIPDSPVVLGNWRDGKAVDMTRAINNGAFMVLHRDHGEIDGWAQPHYRNNSMGSLSNTKLPFILSINCLTGRFDIPGESFAERFHRYTNDGINSGALGLIAATQVSFSFVNDAYIMGIIDNMWPQFMPDYGNPSSYSKIMPAFANVAGKYFLEQSSWPSNPEVKSVTYDLFHHHGDAFLNVYSEVPSQINVSHLNVIRQNQTIFTVQAEENAYVALTYFCQLDNSTKILGRGQSNGSTMDIEILNFPETVQNIMLTATKQNKLRYQKTIMVIPEGQPYVTSLFSSASYQQGSNSSEVINGSTFYLNLDFVNAGTEATTDLVANVTTNDPMVLSLTYNQDIELGQLEAGNSFTSEDSFLVHLADNISDGHQICFIVLVSDSDGNDFSDTVLVDIYSPEFTFEKVFVLDEYNQQSTFVNPGTNAKVIVKALNNGRAVAHEPLISLGSASPYLNITNTLPLLADDLAPGQSEYYSFDISVSQNIPVGESLAFDFSIQQGVEFQHNFEIPVGHPMEFTPGNDSLVAINFPFNNRFRSNRTQMLFLVEELGMGDKTTNAISFNFRNASQNPNFQVFPNLLILKRNTNATSLSGDFESMVSADTLFYNNAAVMPADTGWFTFDIQPYVYSFTQGNIIIEVAWSNFNSSTTDFYSVSGTEFSQPMVVYGSSNEAYYPQYSSYTAASNLRPNIKFHFDNPNPIQENQVTIESKNLVDDSLISGTTIQIGSLKIETDELGQASLDLYNGMYNLYMAHDDYHSLQEAFEVNNTNWLFPFFMSPVYYVNFLVCDQNGNTIEDAVVSINGNEYEAGEYNFSNLTTGLYQYQVSRQGYYDTEGELVLGNEYLLDIDIVMQTDNTGISENLLPLPVQIYPNPAHDKLMVVSGKGATFTGLKIINIFGQVVLHNDLLLDPNQQMEITLNIGELYPGAYLLRLEGIGNPTSIKFIKK